jgi:hypothetical protein
VRRPPAALAAAAAVAALAAGCGGGDGRSTEAEPPAPPEAMGSGYFVGTAPNGVGATVDLLAADPVVAALDRALVPTTSPGLPAPAVGIASVVNDSPRAALAPRFSAVLDTGAVVPLVPAAEALGAPQDAAARRAARLLPPDRPLLDGGASTVQYLVLRGAVPGRVAEVRMTTGRVGPTRLAPRPR